MTGWEAMKLGVVAFLIPFAFVCNPGLLIHGSPGAIAMTGLALAMLMLTPDFLGMPRQDRKPA